MKSQETKTTAPEPERLAYTIAEAAARCGVSYHSIWRLAGRGKIKTVKALRTQLIPRGELERFLSTAD